MNDETMVDENNSLVDLGLDEQIVLPDEVTASQADEIPVYSDDAAIYSEAAPVANSYSIDDVMEALQESASSTPSPTEETAVPVQEYLDAIESLNLTFVEGLNVITGLVGLIVGCIAGTEFFKIWTTN